MKILNRSQPGVPSLHQWLALAFEQARPTHVDEITHPGSVFISLGRVFRGSFEIVNGDGAEHLELIFGCHLAVMLELPDGDKAFAVPKHVSNLMLSQQLSEELSGRLQADLQVKFVLPVRLVEVPQGVQLHQNQRNRSENLYDFPHGVRLVLLLN